MAFHPHLYFSSIKENKNMDIQDYTKVIRNCLEIIEQLKPLLKREVIFYNENNQKKMLYISNLLNSCLYQFHNTQEKKETERTEHKGEEKEQSLFTFVTSNDLDIAK